MQTPETGPLDIDPASIEALQSDEAFRSRAAEMRRDVKETAQQRTPTTGNPTVHAQRAQQAEELMQALHPLLEGLNDLLAEKYPGVEYTPGQVDYVATLGGKILSKYVDISAEKYGEEIALGMFLAVTAARKGVEVYQIEKAKSAEPRKRKKTENGVEPEPNE